MMSLKAVTFTNGQEQPTTDRVPASMRDDHGRIHDQVYPCDASNGIFEITQPYIQHPLP